MIKEIETKETIVNKRVEFVECDSCHKQFHPTKMDDYIEYGEILSINYHGGYGSIFGDGANIQCDLCQHCLKKILGQYIRLS